MINAVRTALAFAAIAFACTGQSLASDGNEPVTDRQIALMMFVDYGRSYGYQTMMASIQVDAVKAELERDQALLKQKETLFRRKAIPQIELEIAKLKDIWNRKQLIVAEKSLTVVAAQYKAMAEMAKHFGGEKIPIRSIYDHFRRGWDAGCEKGPAEVDAMRAWADYSTKSLERARELNSRGNESLASVLTKEAQLKVAQSNFEQRQSRLDRCRSVLFPSLDDIVAAGR
jgi:hypothetical protein